jgi:hypothetical protein
MKLGVANLDKRRLSLGSNREFEKSRKTSPTNSNIEVESRIEGSKRRNLQSRTLPECVRLTKGLTDLVVLHILYLILGVLEMESDSLSMSTQVVKYST